MAAWVWEVSDSQSQAPEVDRVVVNKKAFGEFVLQIDWLAGVEGVRVV